LIHAIDPPPFVIENPSQIAVARLAAHQLETDHTSLFEISHLAAVIAAQFFRQVAEVAVPIAELGQIDYRRLVGGGFGRALGVKQRSR